MIELGGNIFLEGFNEVSPAELLIVKKLIGSYVREVCDKVDTCEKTIISLRSSEPYSASVCFFLAQNQRICGENEDGNLFVSIDKTLKHAIKNLDERNKKPGVKAPGF